jgi:hypothetical protein
MITFGPATTKWLNALTESTRSTYLPGLIKFQNYLQAQELYPEIRDSDTFLKAVASDRKLDLLEQHLLDRELIKGFGAFLSAIENPKPLTPKTIRAYAGVPQSFGKFWGLPISASYAELPPSIVTNEKYPWSIEKIGEFINSMKMPLYRCLGVCFVQSGLSNVDLLRMTYGKVREQLESGVEPLCLKLVRHKTRRFEVKFRTCIGSLGIKFLKEHIASLGSLTDDRLLFQVGNNALEGYFARQAKKFLGDAFKEDERNPCCPSSLRNGFRTLLVDAGCPESFVEYWMGHNLNQDLRKTYTIKSDDSWRETYRKHEPCLTFEG